MKFGGGAAFVTCVGLLLGGCRGDTDTSAPIALVRVVPTGVSQPAAWTLFDRSLASGFTPQQAVQVNLERSQEIVAIRVRGGTPHELRIRDHTK